MDDETDLSPEACARRLGKAENMLLRSRILCDASGEGLAAYFISMAIDEVQQRRRDHLGLGPNDPLLLLEPDSAPDGIDDANRNDILETKPPRL